MVYGSDEDKVVQGLGAAIEEASALGDAGAVTRLGSLLTQYHCVALELDFQRASLGRAAMMMTWDAVVALDQGEHDRQSMLVKDSLGPVLDSVWSRGAQWCVVCGFSAHYVIVTSEDDPDAASEKALRELSRRNDDRAVWLFMRPLELD